MKINDVYKCSGKKYNGEKAIISMTSWSARISTCPKTIFSLLKQCPEFHIVLVLSEEEFPKMEEELPEELMLFVKNNLIELLWVYKNYKAFKKVLFTMDKYREVPVISADDDCIYTCNYAQKLYDKWLENKKNIITYKQTKIINHCQGPITLYPPHCFKKEVLIEKLNNFLKMSDSDDTFFTNIAIENKFIFINLKNKKFPFFFHDCIKPLHPEYEKNKCFKEAFLK